MQTVQIYINDQLVDLGDQGPPPYILQINTLGDLASQQGNLTKQFTLPLTQRNRAIFGFPDDITADTAALYAPYPAKYIQDGVEIIPVGSAVIVSVPNNTVNVFISTGNCDFFDLLGGQLADMGDSTSVWSGYGRNLVWAPYDHEWSVENAARSQQKTDGWIWPIVDYGRIPPIDVDVTLPNRINVRQQRPGFFLHTAIELLVKSTGYKIDYERSSLMKDPLYQKMIIQFANSSFNHGTDYQNTPDPNGFNTVNGTSQRYNSGSTPSGNIRFNPTINFPDGINYTAKENIQGTVTLHFNLFMLGTKRGSKPSQVTIAINVRDSIGNTNKANLTLSLDEKATLVNGGSFASLYTETFTGNSLSCVVDLTAGMVINVNFSVQDSQNTGWEFLSGATLSFIPNDQNVLFNQQVQCERILPDISQLDFLKDTLQNFAIICQANPVTKKVIFAKFSDIVKNIPIAVDWSEKVINLGKEVYFQLGNYVQINWMRYLYDDNANLKLLIPRYFGDDKIIIKDTTITPNQPVQDLFTSQYSPSPNRPYFGGSIAQILMIDTASSNTDFSISVQPRILIDQKYRLNQVQDGTGEKVVFGDQDTADANDIVVNDVISVPYFYKPGGEYNLCFCDKGGQPGLRSRYYPEVEKVLTKTKKMVRYFMLTPQDIKDFDFLIPVYLREDNAYFYVSKIDSWLKGVPCKVELIKL